MTAPFAFEGIKVRGTDHALVVVADGLEQRQLTLGIQLRQDIVEQEQRWLAPELSDELQLSKLQSQHQSSLLPC